MNSNIVFVSENYDNYRLLLSKISLLRHSDSVSLFSMQKLKQCLSNIKLIIIDGSQYNNQTIKKITDKISSNTEIIIINVQETEDFLFENGVYAILNDTATDREYISVLKKCFEKIALSEKISILKSFLYGSEGISLRNDFFTLKALKDSYCYLLENNNIKNGVLLLLTIDDASRTKISMGRLSGLLQKYLRETDIVAYRGRYFYLILPNTSVSGAKIVVDKLCKKMGKECALFCGGALLNDIDFSAVEKQAKDSLKAAYCQNENCVFIDNLQSDDWLCEPENKHYKLFDVAFTNKVKNIISPLFYRFEKDFSANNPQCSVIQYANKNCSYIKLKENTFESELKIIYDGFAKIIVTITHSGLDSCENTNKKLGLNELNEKELNKILNQFISEFRMN